MHNQAASSRILVLSGWTTAEPRALNELLTAHLTSPLPRAQGLSPKRAINRDDDTIAVGHDMSAKVARQILTVPPSPLDVLLPQVEVQRASGAVAVPPVHCSLDCGRINSTLVKPGLCVRRQDERVLAGHRRASEGDRGPGEWALQRPGRVALQVVPYCQYKHPQRRHCDKTQSARPAQGYSGPTPRHRQTTGSRGGQTGAWRAQHAHPGCVTRTSARPEVFLRTSGWRSRARVRRRAEGRGGDHLECRRPAARVE